MNQQKFILKAFKSGMMEKMILKEIVRDLPKEERDKYFKEGVPAEIKKAIREEIHKQLLDFGISEEQIQELEK